MSRSSVPPPVTLVLDASEAWLPARLAAVERRIADRITDHGEALAADARATLEAGGKRLRPMLVLLCAGPAAGEEAIRAAAAVELVHMATLVHDDVLDAAPLRRGRTTVYASSGRAAATSLGDLLFSRAFTELAADGAERQVELLSSASVGLARGELEQRRDAFELTVTADRYLRRCELKTARLFECACVIGREDPAADRALREFGREVGLAFQLLDDVLDVAGPAERTGKARGTDLLDGTVTLPLIIARERDTELGAIDLRALDGVAAADACDRIAATGALDDVRAAARARVEAGKRAAAAAPIEPEQLRLLELVADGVVERYS